MSAPAGRLRAAAGGLSFAPVVRSAPRAAALLSLLLSAGACRAPLPTAPTSSMRTVPLGLCEDYPEESRSLQTVRQDMQILRAAGVRVLRVSIGWDGLEPERDRYHWAFWDAFVDIAVRDSGVRLIPYVAYTPRWNSAGGEADYWKTPPRDLAQFAEVMGLLAARYRDRIDSWEIWNEPDNRDYWLGDAAAYARLLRAGAEAVRRANPRARVVVGGIAGHPEFLRALFAAGGAAFADVVNAHAYFETWNPDPLESLPAYAGALAGVIRAHRRGQPLWMAEVGYSDYRPLAAPAGDVRHTPPYQAVMLVRTVALALAIPEVELLAWYELKDPPATDAMIGDDNNRHLGVTFTDYRPKPALAALRFMSELFAGGFRPLPAAASPPAGTTRPPYTLRAFLLADGRAAVMAWLPSDAPPDVRLRVDVTLPLDAAGTATLHDSAGTPIRPLAARHAPGRTTLLELPLEPASVTIALVAVATSAAGRAPAPSPRSSR